MYAQKKLQGYAKASTIQKQSDKNIPISKIMTPANLYAYPDQSIVELLKIVTENNISNIPVVSEENKLLGLITNSSLVTTLSTQFIEEDKVGGIAI